VSRGWSRLPATPFLIVASVHCCCVASPASLGQFQQHRVQQSPAGICYPLQAINLSGTRFAALQSSIRPLQSAQRACWLPIAVSIQQLRQRVDGGLGLLDPAQLRHQLFRFPE